MYLGPLVMEKLLFPNLPMYYKRLEPALNSSNPDLIQRLEAQNCLGTLVVRALFTHIAALTLFFSAARIWNVL